MENQDKIKRPYSARRKDTRVRKRTFHMLERTPITDHLLGEAVDALVKISAAKGVTTTPDMWSAAETLRRGLIALKEQAEAL